MNSIEKAAEITMSESTEREYFYRYNLLLLRYARAKRELGTEADPLDFCRWLCLLKMQEKWRYSTWRVYRSAVIFGLDNQVKVRSGFNADIVEQGINLLYGRPGELVLADSDREWWGSFQVAALCSSRPLRTSTQKQKALPEDIFEAIFALLVGDWSARRYSGQLLRWLLAGRLTGLRPVEWVAASLMEGRGSPPALHVRNAKATNGRSNGETRILVLEDFSEEHLIVVRAQLAQCKAADDQGRFKAFHKACSQFLAEVTKHLYPRRKLRPTLYSARHQFLANAKASGRTSREVAALAGHASAETAKTHYARSNVGDETAPRVLPIPTQVDTVKDVRDWTPGTRKSPSRSPGGVDGTVDPTVPGVIVTGS